jgi:release factor glutamine methyltransferase
VNTAAAPTPRAVTAKPPREASAPGRVDEALSLARRLGVERLDALALLAHHLGRPRSWLLAHDDAPLPDSAAHAVGRDLLRRADLVPLAYLTGCRGFHGVDLQVGPAVLDPRPDTETLVDWALELLGASSPHLGRAGPAGATTTSPASTPQAPPIPPVSPVPAAAASACPLGSIAHPQVLDLGTGSGAIALAVARSCPRAEVHASDADPAALAVAAANAARLGLGVRCHLGPWWSAALGLLPLHLALSNPPYLAADDPHLPALRHEPRQALVPASGGALDDLWTLIDGAPAHLAVGGWLLLEHGWDQGEAVAARLRERGFVAVSHRHDLAGRLRCTGGCWPGG